jgi:hypothetical protein
LESLVFSEDASMKSKPSLEPELMLARGRRRWYRLPQSIAELMVVVAISALGLAVLTEGSRRLNKGLGPKPRLMTVPRGVPPTPVPQPFDPMVIEARQGIDDAMIKQAPEGIDDAMIIPHPRLARAPAELPLAPVTPSQPQQLQPRPLR